MKKKIEEKDEEFISPTLKRIEQKAEEAKRRIDEGSEVNITPYDSFDGKYTFHIR